MLNSSHEHRSHQEVVESGLEDLLVDVMLNSSHEHRSHQAVVDSGLEDPLVDVMLNLSPEHRSHKEVVELVTQELSSRWKTWQHIHIGRKYGELFHDRILR